MKSPVTEASTWLLAMRTLVLKSLLACSANDSQLAIAIQQHLVGWMKHCELELRELHILTYSHIMTEIS